MPVSLHYAPETFFKLDPNYLGYKTKLLSYVQLALNKEIVYFLSHARRSNVDWTIYTGLAGVLLAIKNASRILNIQDSGDLSMRHYNFEPANARIGGLYGTETGPLLLSVVEGAISWETFIETIKSVHLGRLESEMLYGKAGLLAALVISRGFAPSKELSREINNLVDKVHTSIMESSCSYDGAVSLQNIWSWHNSKYTGAIHGLAGIYASLLIASGYNLEIASDLMALLAWLRQESQFSTSKLPSSQPQINSKRLTQFCHGSPGTAASVLAILDKCPGLPADTVEMLEQILLELLEDTWTHGLLKKGFSLCHGIAGNGFVFLEASHYFKGRDDPKSDMFLAMAVHFARHILDQVIDPLHEPDHPHSLMEGSAGVLAFLSQVYARMEGGAVHFPSFFTLV